MEVEDNKIGLISGEGEFPVILARSLKDKNYEIIAVCFSNGQKERLKKFVSEVFKISIGQLGKLIKIFKEREVKNLVFLGKIDKSYALRVGIPDFKALALWKNLKNREDNSILKSVIEELEKEGFVVRGPSEFLQEFLTPEGIFTKRAPTAEEWEDIKYGFKIAKIIGSLDVGQCVVVKDKMTVAVEAMEGTDATILRAGRLRKNTVVIKVAKPIQDLRMDLPVVGLKTVETLVKSNAKVLVLEAGKTFFLQKEEAVKLANKHKISIVGYNSKEENE
ncbi:MAG: UDP-2,3-diacylglucosamine diphosphatase LpxI [Thermodesulfobacterium sp.]|nr:UDP-2,3-diacylglucosamine diphosphatase LpxI [Thermodesulfobacterium sp.]